MQTSTTATAPRPPLPVLTSLRFFAAAEVVLFHYFRPIISHSSYGWGIVSWGSLAVIFFFILSGFILTYVYWGPAKNLSVIDASGFWRARIARIAPAYYLGLCLSLPGLVYTSLFLKSTPKSDLLLGLSLAPIFLQAWSSHTSGILNPPAWSLSVECLFYVLFPFIPNLLRKVPGKFLLLFAYAFAVAASPFAPIELNPAFGFQLPAPICHLPEFIFGIALAWMYLSHQPSSRAAYKTIFFASAASLLILYTNRVLIPPWLFGEILQVPLFGLLIYGGAGMGRKMGVLTHPFVVLLGEASYAMYILHFPISFWWSSVTRRLHLNLSTNSDCILYFTTVCLLSIASFLYFESPLRRRILGHSAHKAA